MSVPVDREEARKRVKGIVSSFRINGEAYCSSTSIYNETQVRTDYITPLLEAFGWDVYNKSNKPSDLREVYEEATVEVGDEKLSKKPDYELRAVRQRKFFVEAKRPSINLQHDISSAFQVRRYGFSASLPISILTNFRQLVIYDCLHVPFAEDSASVARLGFYNYEEFESKFDELYDRISKEAVFSGSFDNLYIENSPVHEVQQFDTHFLRQVSDWRIRLALNIHGNKPDLSSEELTFIVQLFISRIVFLRICEDREIEKYQTLKDLNNAEKFKNFMQLLRNADDFYDSGLFDLLVDESFGIEINDGVLSEIIEELYYPQSPYTFSVVEAGVLGEIYEMFLGDVISIDANGALEVIQKPEVRESGGVVPTPQFIVSDILERTLVPALKGKSPKELTEFTIADICCGSGVFLLGAFDVILNHHLNWYIQNADESSNFPIYEIGNTRWKLQFKEKRRILVNSIRGVDIDSNALEIAKFSLMLKLLEQETSESILAFFESTKQKVLPRLDNNLKFGNSLVSHDFFIGDYNQELIDKINPFTWNNEFPSEMEKGGFDVVVGNPPYIRIQNMMNYSPEEVELYKAKNSPYITSKCGNFDKYSLFIERSIMLTNSKGVLGLIVPNKFLTTAVGGALRNLIASNSLLRELVHFGAIQVFGNNTSNYTCMIILDKTKNEKFHFEKVEDLVSWKYRQGRISNHILSNSIDEKPWSFCSEVVTSIFERLNANCLTTLGGKKGVADIFVGVQTSNDSVYIFSPKREQNDVVFFEKDGREWEIEKEILRPCLHDVQLSAYGKPNANKYMIFPYRVEGERATLIQPEEMQVLFPKAWAYFKTKQNVLEERNIVGGSMIDRQWYQYGRSQSLTKFTGNKIILPILSLEPRYAYDDQNIVVTGGGNGPYYLVSPKSGDNTDLLFVLTLLCHPLSEAMIRMRTSVFKGGYYSHGKQYIEYLPIPKHSTTDKKEIAELALKAISLKETIGRAKVPQQKISGERSLKQVRKVIEDRISTLFGLSEEEICIIRDIPVPT